MLVRDPLGPLVGPISAFASIKLERQREEDLDRFAEAVARWPEVVDCYLMTGQPRRARA